MFFISDKIGQIVHWTKKWLNVVLISQCYCLICRNISFTIRQLLPLIVMPCILTLFCLIKAHVFSVNPFYKDTWHVLLFMFFYILFREFCKALINKYHSRNLEKTCLFVCIFNLVCVCACQYKFVSFIWSNMLTKIQQQWKHANITTFTSKLSIRLFLFRKRYQ